MLVYSLVNEVAVTLGRNNSFSYYLDQCVNRVHIAKTVRHFISISKATMTHSSTDERSHNPHGIMLPNKIKDSSHKNQ